MPSDALDLIWRSADVGSPLFAGDEMSTWTPGLVQCLKDLGLLRPTRTASQVNCDACGESHRVGGITYPDGQARFYARCPENGRIEVDQEQLRQWYVDFAPILAAVAHGLGIKAEPQEVAPGRVWKIGRAAIAGRSRVAWAARRAYWKDVPRGKSVVLFLLGHLPVDGAPDLHPDSVVELHELISLSNGNLSFDRKPVDDQLASTSEVIKKKTPKKRASRSATIDALQQELTAHLIAARDHVHAARQRGDPPELLPRPKQKDLAVRLGIPESAVSRALRDPAAQMLKVLWEAAEDLDQVLKFRPPRRS